MSGCACPPAPSRRSSRELRFQHLGDTEGYGTVQFSDATVQAVQAALKELRQFQGVNSIFGEGFSPKFRKMRDGMEVLGFNATVLMRHDQQRRMYAVPMWPEADSFLRGEQAKAPNYLRRPGQFRDATARIAEFWRQRWLAGRLNHAPSIAALRTSKPWVLSERIEVLPRNEEDPMSGSRKKAKPPEPAAEPCAVALAAPSGGRLASVLARPGPCRPRSMRGRVVARGT